MSEKIKAYEILNFSKFFDFCLVLFCIYLTNFYSYLLFHTLIEFFCIIVAGCIFVIAWNGRRIIQNNYLLFIGIAYLFVGGIDLMHALSYTGMRIIEGYGTDLPTQLWIAARYLESLSLLCAPFFLGRKLKSYYELVAYLLVTGLILASIFYWHNFPVCFIEGVGLTPFKKISEYVISIILLASLAGLFNKRKHFDDDVLNLLNGVIVVTIFSELSFTFYIHVYDISNLIGHLLKVVSFYLFYRAIVVTSFLRPYAILFKDLTNREAENRRLLEQQVNWRKRLEEMIFSQNAVFENLNEGLMLADVNGNIVDVNPKGLELLEFEDIKDALIHRNHYLDLFEVYGLDGRSISLEDRPLSRVLRKEKFTNYELLVQRTSTGKTWICSFSGSPVYDKKEEFILAVMILRDITIEKQSEMSLIKSHKQLEVKTRSLDEALKSQIEERERAEKLYRQVGDMVPYGIWVCDPKGKIVYMSESFLNMLGTTFEEFTSTDWTKRLTSQSAQAVISGWQQWIDSGEAWDHELSFYDKDENHKTILSRGVPIRNKEGDIICYGGVNLDISERKILENALAKERENFYFVLEKLPAFVCLVRKDFTIAYANQHFKERFGNPEGKLCHQLLYHREDPCEGCRMPLVFEYHKEHVWEMVQGADRRVYHVYNYPYVDTGGTRMLLKMGVDITQRVEAEKKLNQYSKELELSNKELQNFAYVASHDLQEPLRKIQMFGNRLRTKYIDFIDDTGKDYFTRMENAANRMRNLIQALLQYSRITTKSQHFATVDLNVVVSEVVSDLEELIFRTNGRMEIINLAVIDAEPNQMHQLFQNLITNGLKFNDKPDPHVRISGKILDLPDLHKETKSILSYHQITVEDNGIGFEQEYADQIFTPFQRVHGSHKYEGTGIGLSICRKIVERHHGTITAKSVLEVGSAFIVTLPVKQDKTEE